MESLARQPRATAEEKHEDHSSKEESVRLDTPVGVPDEIYSFLGIYEERGDRSVQRKVNDILAFLNKANPSATISDLMWAIQSLESRLGSPNVGVKRYDHLFHYITIQRQIESLENTKRKLYGR